MNYRRTLLSVGYNKLVPSPFPTTSVVTIKQNCFGPNKNFVFFVVASPEHEGYCLDGYRKKTVAMFFSSVCGEP
jgi:hypothetical protein